MAVNMAPPPTSALPQLPVSKLRGPATTPEVSRISSPSPTASKLALRTPSKALKPLGSLPGTYAASSPNVPTLRSASAHQDQSQAQANSEGANKEVRRSVSIANFPQPPKVQRRTGIESKYSSAAYYSIPDTSRGIDRRDTRSSRGSESAEPRTGSLRPKRLKPKTSYGTLGQVYSSGTTPTLLDGSGNSKAIKNAQPGTSGTNDIASLQSPAHSRSSSAQGSYSTSATTFEEGDEKRGREGAIVQVENGSKRRDSEKEGKGNVIVSVRVRPDAGGDKTSGKEWLVDGRQSLVAYKGREGGDYFYGERKKFRCSIRKVDVLLFMSHCTRSI